MATIDQTTKEAFDICWARADNDPKGFTIKDSAGAAIDITGFSFSMTVNSEKNPTINPPEFTVAGVLDDPTNGKVSFSPLTTETDIAPGTYWYDIQQTDTASKVKTLVKGKLLIIQDITK
jgi:hypothetical protein